MSELGKQIKPIELKTGFFGKKPTALELYENGFILKFKQEDRTIPFSQVSAIKSSNYGAPMPLLYNFDVFGSDSKKLSSFEIPYEQVNDATLLFQVHAKYLLPEGWQKNLLTTTYQLDNYTTWRDGKLYMKWKKGIEEIPLSDIAGWEMKNGSNYFTFQNCKLSGMIYLYDSFNTMAVAEICREIAELAKTHD